MSELFNALQKLEEKNAPEDVPVPPPVSGDSAGRKGRRVPYLRALLLLLFVLLVTGGVLAFLWLHPDLSFFRSTVQQTISSQDVLPLAAEPPPEVLPEALPKDVLMPDDTVTEEPITGENGVGFTGNTRKDVDEIEKPTVRDREDNDIAIAVEEKQDVVKKQQNNETVSQKFVRQRLQSQSVDIVHDVEREREMVQRKRLMSRAEHLRMQGDSNEALGLYKKAWSITPGSALANNIAAILISIEQYAKAESYLQRGLQLTPNDEDLLFNLKIVQQGKKQKK